MSADVKLYKHRKHDRFWIKNEVLYENYDTLRGLRYQEIMKVPGVPDEDKCNEACLKYVSKEFLNQKYINT